MGLSGSASALPAFLCPWIAASLAFICSTVLREALKDMALKRRNGEHS